MGCCNSTGAHKLHASESGITHQESQLADLVECDKVGTIGRVQEITQQSKQLRTSLGKGDEAGGALTRRYITVRLQGAKKLANLDFSIANTLTVGVASAIAGQDVSDPYALLAVGEAGLPWSERQHCGPVMRSSTIFDNLNPEWNETLQIRAADDIVNPELHIVLYDYDAAIPGNILSVEDDFLGEIRIPVPMEGKNEDDVLGFHDVVDAPLIGELAEAEGSTISFSWRRDTLGNAGGTEAETAPQTAGQGLDGSTISEESKNNDVNMVDYMISATTWSDSYVYAYTAQPIYAMIVGDRGSTPLVCLQDESEQVMFTDADSHYELRYQDIGTPLYIAVQLKHSKPHHSWGLAKFSISRYGKTWEFPFYSWLYSGKPAAIIFEGTSMTPAEMHALEGGHTIQDHRQHEAAHLDPSNLKKKHKTCYSSIANYKEYGGVLRTAAEVEEEAKKKAEAAAGTASSNGAVSAGASSGGSVPTTPGKIKNRLTRKTSFATSPVAAGLKKPRELFLERKSDPGAVSETAIELVVDGNPSVVAEVEAGEEGKEERKREEKNKDATVATMPIRTNEDAAEAEDGILRSSVHSQFFMRMDSSEGGGVKIAEDGAPHTDEYNSAIAAMKKHVQHDETRWDMYDVKGHDASEATSVRVEGVHTHTVIRGNSSAENTASASAAATAVAASTADTQPRVRRSPSQTTSMMVHDPERSTDATHFNPEETLRQYGAVAPLDAPVEQRYIKLMEARDLEIKTHQQEYPWAKDLYASEGSDWRILPGQIAASGKYGPIHSKNLPVTERFANDKQSDYFWIGVRGIANCYLSKFVGKFHPFSHFDDVLTLFRNIPFPSVIKRWKEDAEFARQWLQGYDPVQILQWPEKGSVQDVALRKKFPCDNDKTLGWPAGKFESQCAKGKLFYLDFVKLEGMDCWDDLPPKKFHQNGKRPRFCAASLCLFSVEDNPKGKEEAAEGATEAPEKNSERNGILMPVAIQLGQDPTKVPLFTLNGDETGTTQLDWLLAKMYVQNSGANMHQIISHAMKTHLISEPFVIAAERNLAHVHPLWKLIKRHTRYTLAINTKARNGLINAGGIFDEFISCGGGGHMKLCGEEYSTWNLLHNNLRKNLEARGCLDEDALPYYPYRDDGLLVWDAMEAYVREVVCMHYKDDADIQVDKELAAFAQDIAKHGHTEPQFDPAWLRTREGTIEVFTILIWTVSCQHSSVNFGQYKYLGFPLNAPMSLYKDPLTLRPGQIKSESQIMKEIMPSQHQICRQIAVAYMLGA
jgi:hypothetical protein